MVTEIVEVFHHDLLQHVQVSYHNVCLLTNIEPANVVMVTLLYTQDCHEFVLQKKSSIETYQAAS